jgi:hypothetical protein
MGESADNRGAEALEKIFPAEAYLTAGDPENRADRGPGKDPEVVRAVAGEAANALETLAKALEELFADRPGEVFDSGEWLGVPTVEIYLHVPWDFDPNPAQGWPYGRPRHAYGPVARDSSFRWLRGEAIPPSAAGAEAVVLGIVDESIDADGLASAGRVRLTDRWRLLSVPTHSALFLDSRAEGWEEMPHVYDSFFNRYAIPRELREWLDDRIGPGVSRAEYDHNPDRLAAVDVISYGYLLGYGIFLPRPVPVGIGEPLLDLLNRDVPDADQLPKATFDFDGKQAAALVRFAPLWLDPEALRSTFKIDASLVVFDGPAGETKRFPTRAEIPAVAAALRRLASSYRPAPVVEETILPADRPESGFKPATPPAGPRPKTPTTLLDVRSRMDPEILRLNSFAVSGTLPRSWRKARRWEEAVSEEIEKRLRIHGESAFEKTARGPAPLTKRNGSPALTKSAETELMVSLGSRGGFIRRDKDGEWLERALRVGAGWVSVGVSWYRSTERLASDRRQQWAAELKAQLGEAGGQRKLSFDELTDEQRRGVEWALERIGTLDDARTLLDAVLRRAFAEGVNIVDIPARELRLLLQCDGPGGRGNERIRRGLAALEELSFKVRHKALKGLPDGRFQGRFVASHGYFEGGSGAHSDGIFVVELSSVVPGVVGLLNEAEAGKRKLAGDRATALLTATGSATEGAIDLLTGEKPRLRQRRKKGERPAKAISTVGPWRKQAVCRSIHEERAFDFLETNLTTSGAADSLQRSKKERFRSATPDGLRIYRRDWCPLLSDGEWVAAIGTHRRNPEAGWRLTGKAAPATGTGGQRPAGLIDFIGRAYPSGGAREERRRAETETLADFATVLERLGGILVGVSGPGGARSKPSSWRWVSLAEALQLPPEELRKIRWFPFLPADWHRRADEIVEANQAERVARGEADRPVRVSRSPDEYLAAAEADGVQWQHKPGRVEPLVTWGDDGRPAAPAPARPLGERLEERIDETGIRKADLARAFGVSPQSVSRWVRPIDEREQKKGSGVPAALAGLVERWIEGGELPSAEELEAVSSRNGKPRR